MTYKLIHGDSLKKLKDLPDNSIDATISDPFAGSWSTGKACMLEGKNFIGIDITKEYVKIAENRISKSKKDYEKEHAKDKFFTETK